MERDRQQAEQAAALSAQSRRDVAEAERRAQSSRQSEPSSEQCRSGRREAAEAVRLKAAARRAEETAAAIDPEETR